MSAPSSSDYLSCLKMWRSGAPTTWQQRFAQHVVKRERVENNKVQLEIEAAERSLARLQLAVRASGAEYGDEDLEVSDCLSQDESTIVSAGWGSSISFAGRYHPEHRDPMRRGTPAVMPTISDGYLADDEREVPRTLRRTTRCSGNSDVSLPYLAPTPPTPELLQSPVYALRALNPSEVWDEEATVVPIIYAPVPLRPLIQPELLLVGYEESHLGQDSNSSSTAERYPEGNTDPRIKRIGGLLDDLNKIHDDLTSFLENRRAFFQDNQGKTEN